jgi:hypothetical protein
MILPRLAILLEHFAYILSINRIRSSSARNKKITTNILTKNFNVIINLRWKLFLKFIPDSTNVPLGKVLLLSLMLIKYPLLESLPLYFSTIDLFLTQTIKASLSRPIFLYNQIPSGSYSTPLPSTIPIIISLDIFISFEPKSPSGPPVINL